MIKSLTSLRFFFALFVFLDHCKFLFTNGLGRILYKNVFSEGFLGVSFFFILSGFILAYNYAEKINGNFSLKKFYIARFARIYPLHFLTLLVALCLGYWHNGVPGLLANITLTQSFVPNDQVYYGLNSVSWSISDEAFFYLLFPLITLPLLNLSKNKSVIFVGLMVCSSLIINSVFSGEMAHYFTYIFPPSRLMDFILGILVFKFFRSTKTQTLKNATLWEASSLVLLTLFFIQHSKVPLTYRFSLYYWLPMVFLIYVFTKTNFSQAKGFFTKILQNKALIFLGEISFAFYLIHSLVLQIFRDNAPDFKGFYAAGIIFSITLLISSIAHLYIEKPANKFLKNLLKA